MNIGNTYATAILQAAERAASLSAAAVTSNRTVPLSGHA
jgi:hypothetical protein